MFKGPNVKLALPARLQLIRHKRNKTSVNPFHFLYTYERHFNDAVNWLLFEKLFFPTVVVSSSMN